MNTIPEGQERLDDPIDLLQTCHEKATHFVSLLERLQRYLRGARRADTPAQETSLQLIRYFDRAAPDHHADEEQDLFPLIAAASSATDDLQSVMRNLTDQHRELEALYLDIRHWLCAVCEGSASIAPISKISAFASLYRAHIEIEERLVLPAARSLLQDCDRGALGRTMLLRRGAGMAIAGEQSV